HAHVASMDASARGLLIAAKMIEDGKLANNLKARYAKWNEPRNQAMLLGEESLEEIAKRIHQSGLEPKPSSGRQEFLEGMLNTYF
ncbi:MAG TPA: xylose isomerase, partial [Aestuariivirga sp.]|nr:xylose isomerase [Aestuariivirga sp.]